MGRRLGGVMGVGLGHCIGDVGRMGQRVCVIRVV